MTQRLARTVTRVGSLVALAGAVHAAVNAAALEQPLDDPPVTTRPVAVLVPARDEAGTIAACLRALRSQLRVPGLRIVVLDDGSADGTGPLAAAAADADPRVLLRTGSPLPPGWLGKPHACAQLAATCPDAEILVWIDADVVLGPLAIAAATEVLERTGAGLVSPFPRQVAVGVPERLVQPLLAWSVLTLLPLRIAARSARPSMVAVTGQWLVTTREAYDRAGGHSGVRAEVLEDLALARAVRRSGGGVRTADGSRHAECRMYAGWAPLRAGYGKWLPVAFGSPAGAGAVLAALSAVYLVPPLAALRGSRWGLLGYLAAVAGRVVCARRTGGRVWPDAAAHPVSVGVAGWVTVEALWHRRWGIPTWKGRPV